VALLLNGLAMRGQIHQLGLGGCQQRNLNPPCAASLAQFNRIFGTWIGLVPILVLLVPVSTGAFAGAAVVARDFERGTFRFAWTQGCGGPRLLAARVTVIATALLLGSAAAAALAGWWFSPLYALGYARLNPQYFGTQGPAFATWTLLAFAIAVLAGSVLRRVVVAVATTLAAYAGLAVPATIVLRYRYYRPPVPVTAGLGQTSLTLPPRSVPTGTWWIGTGGTVIPRAQIEHAISSLQPAALVRWVLRHDARLVVSYQPDSRFWPFQWTETAWLSVIAGLLLAAAVTLARPRAFSRSAIVRLVTSAAAVTLAGAICAAILGLPATASTHPAASAPAPAPTATTTVPDPNGPGYLALGDSVAFGSRPESVTPAEDYLNPANFTGYPEDLAKALDQRQRQPGLPRRLPAARVLPGLAAELRRAVSGTAPANRAGHDRHRRQRHVQMPGHHRRQLHRRRLRPGTGRRDREPGHDTERPAEPGALPARHRGAHLLRA